ncbi:MAG: GTP cyclohydrolase FolE2 [Burkholderiaceae bacterium]|nr:GTP cyclohydrolase FolE2 [Burkholderiaceae bacterium]
MPDVQGEPDRRNLAIDRVGVRGLRYPVLVQANGQAQPSVAEFELSVSLPAGQKGTHMSRFVGLLEAMSKEAICLSPASLRKLSKDMVAMLEARDGSFNCSFPFFIRKTAPVSGVQSLMDYKVALSCDVQGGEPSRLGVCLKVPVKSLCPCSKEISDYGAHNQRSEVTVEVFLNPSQPSPSLESLIQVVEAQASCELWGLLKRPDEKYVTEKAYDNAKFVEDLVRDVALSIRSIEAVEGFRVEAENFESIHNHSAWARILG